MNEIEKLRILLPHWVEHNVEHVSDLRTWAERVRALGEERLAAYIEAAAQRMEDANRELESAAEHLGEAAGDRAPGHLHLHSA